MRSHLALSLLAIFFFIFSPRGEARGTDALQPIVLWPNGAPGAVGKESADIPTLTPYLPVKEKATGAAIIICPGGGYHNLGWDVEGEEVADWLNSIGMISLH